MKNLLLTLSLLFTLILTSSCINDANTINKKADVEITALKSIEGQTWSEINSTFNGDLKEGNKLYIYGATLTDGKDYRVTVTLNGNYWELESIKTLSE
ncbi:hypothetical protein NC796_07635 [Aliifodinibius sp. S!AR15-10]|uniref:hypothetical protein n=1 Tax=Aliifodinibius sp. S!AR15-10 TaxID=2950437 RepID=UPI00285EED92|nr:hypothetical protein [Aliifodinibius sp. S!AR15-10]MDR8391003.1 hypothetical protein [Aliifodinibius sp. S!AR15-10]